MTNVVKISQFTNLGAPSASDLVTGLQPGPLNANFVITGGGETGLDPVLIEASQTLLTNTRNFVVGGSQWLITLPATSNVNDVIVIDSLSNFGWQIVQRAGQQVQVLNKSTTLGVTGYVQSNTQGDSITMVCTAANTNWFCEVVTASDLVIN